MPEPYLPIIQRTLWDHTPVISSGFKASMMGMRKLLRAKKMPDVNSDEKYHLVRKEAVSIYPIGIKPDVYDEKIKRESL